MRRLTCGALALALACAAIPAAASAQAKDTTRTIDPDAMARLLRMGAYLRTLKSFQVQAAFTTDEVLVDGRLVQFGGNINVVAEQPNRIRAETTSDRKERVLLYDGKNFTVWARRMNYYATVPATGTLRELVDYIDNKYAIEMPLVDLFKWGLPDADTLGISIASDVGPADINGTSTRHYVFRQPDVDWQIWIQEGDFPLPRKLVVTTRTDDSHPQYSAVYTWNLAPSYNEATFVFTPPKDANRITLAEAGTMASTPTKK